MTPYALGLELTVLLSVWLCLAVWQKDPATPGRGTFILLALAAASWALGDLWAERQLTGSDRIGDRIKYVGVLTVPALWLGLAAHVARLDVAQRVPWFPAVLIAPLGCAYALLYSPTWSELFLRVDPDGGHHTGPIWWVCTFYGYALALTGSTVLIRSALRQRRRRRWQQLVLGLSACVPIAGNGAFVAAGIELGQDPTPVLMALSLLALQSALYSGGLLQLLPLSQYDLVQQLPIGVLLTDRDGSVVSVNPAAEARLGISEERAVGRGFQAVLEGARVPPRTECVALRAMDREAGQIVLLDPPRKLDA